MIARYSREEMTELWEASSRWGYVLKVEKAVAKAQATMGLIPRAAAASIEKKAKFQVDKILEIEKTTKHDVIAFVQNVAENVGEHGSYVHFGLTSSDVLDTAFCLQIRDAYKLVEKELYKLSRSLEKLVKKHKGTLCVGRTHGIHAEPTTLGFRMSGYLAEIERRREGFANTIESNMVAKISGAVGQFSVFPPDLEKRVAKLLELKPETVATQVIPRDRMAEVILQLSLLGGFIERLSLELRHMQRTEVGEVIEGFTPGQKGSSAMPHKKNPISAENLTGIARLLRSNAVPAMENIALWHERDISHSSVERVMFPDAFILADYAVSRMTTLIDGLYVDEKRLRANVDLTQGQVFSSHVLVELVKKGAKREEAYEKIQTLAHSLKPGDHLHKKMKQDSYIQDYLKAQELEKIFSGKLHTRHVNQIVSQIKVKPLSKD